MVNAFLLLVLMQLAGEFVVGSLGIPVPGMVVGLLLLLGLLVLRARRLGPHRAIPPDLDATARGLHANLGLLFVPAGAGVMAQYDLLATEGMAILGAVVLSTAVTIAVTAGIVARSRVPTQMMHLEIAPDVAPAPDAPR